MNPSEELLKQVKARQSPLRPTATVVRGRDGKIKVERQDLLTESQKEERVATSAKAGKLRKGLPKELADPQLNPQYQFPVVSGVVYEYRIDGNKKRAEWKPCSLSNETNGKVPMPSSEAALSSIDVVSFNVWFSEYEWEARLDGLVDLLSRDSRANVVCLQEVTSRFLGRLLENYPFIQQRYRLAASIAPNAWYGVCMLIEKSLPVPVIGQIQLPTRMGRRALVANFSGALSEDSNEIALQDKRALAIATVHLESLNSQSTRSQQLQLIHQELDKYDTALLVGDFNITATGPWADQEENDMLTRTNLSGFVDWWTKCHAEEAEGGATFDTQRNPMLAAHTRFADSSRYDRACVKDEGCWKADAIKITGDEPVGNDSAGRPIFISDHFGLAMRLVKKLAN